jgi:phosphoribosyl 1,2-cyclic phosphodiesterase
VEIACLGSGSDGNAFVIRHEQTVVLLDCGLSAARLSARLASLGLVAGQVRAVFLSHEHADHVCGVEAWGRRRGIPFFASRGTARALGFRLRSPSAAAAGLVALRAGEPVWFGGLEVLPFRVSHDAAEPLGYRFSTAEGAHLGVVTDTGVATPEAVEALMGCRVLGLESNHCLDMLARGPYPGALKRRILSDCGHLSNRAAGELLARVASAELETVLALHLSKVNNTPQLATSTLAARLEQLGLRARVMAPGAQSPAWHGVE